MKHIQNELNKRFTSNGGKPIVITMKSTGLAITLERNADGSIGAYGEKSAIWFSGKNLAETAEKISRYDAIHKKWEAEYQDCKEFHAYLCTHSTGSKEHDWENFCAYAEQHLSVFGFRPAYLQFGVPETVHVQGW